jgi:hypothetical protein
VCNKTGKSFGELIDHFILGGDETNLMKKVAIYRGSITMYRTGVAAGHNAPTVFLLKGKKRKSGFNETFLRQEGCALGSTICMTENAYMTEEAWEGMAPSIVKGYRALPRRKSERVVLLRKIWLRWIN